MVLVGSTAPVQASTPVPIMATPIARPHMRARVQSPMLTTSETAPMVQKCVRCSTAPNRKVRTNVLSSTVRESAARSISGMCGGRDGFWRLLYLRTRAYAAPW
ncbi:hypothetical protein D3C72_1832720 [compost metagenome]